MANFKAPFLDTIAQVALALESHKSLNEIFESMVYIVPEPYGYLPIGKNRLTIYYVGPIFWKGFASYVPSRFEKIKPTGKTLYLTFGGTGLNGEKLVELSNLLLDRDFQVVVSSSTVIAATAFPNRRNLYVSKYLPGAAICQRVDAVVCHGGYGTMMQSFLADKPVITLPFNPDQSLHSWRFQELGLGKCVIGLNLSFVKADWHVFRETASKVQATRIVDSVDSVLLERDKYVRAIGQFKKNLSTTEGSERAADIIEQVTP